MTKISNARGTPIISAKSIDMPVTPPSMKWLDNKKPFSPNAAEAIPRVIKSIFFPS
jgi:hypothetical protein